MRALTILAAAVGCCAANASLAEPHPEHDQGALLVLFDGAASSEGSGYEAEPSGGDVGTSKGRRGVSVQVEQFSDSPVPFGSSGNSERDLPPRRQVTIASSFLSASGLHSISGTAGQGSDPALGPPMSFMRRYAGIDNPDMPHAVHWLHGNSDGSQVFTLGYAWRELQLEGSAFSRRQQEEGMPPAADRLKIDSRSARLTFRPSSKLSVQFSKGSLGTLDQVVAGGDVRRTTLSSTYRHSFDFGEWESTLAWGRNSRRSRETTVGYLAESSLRLHQTHVFFGRIERVGSDELLRQDESIQRTPFKLSKLTLGYFQDVKATPVLSVDTGILVSRYLVPSQVAPSYGNDPTGFMAFVRLKFR